MKGCNKTILEAKQNNGENEHERQKWVVPGGARIWRGAARSTADWRGRHSTRCTRAAHVEIASIVTGRVHLEFTNQCLWREPVSLVLCVALVCDNLWRWWQSPQHILALASDCRVLGHDRAAVIHSQLEPVCARGLADEICVAVLAALGHTRQSSIAICEIWGRTDPWEASSGLFKTTGVLNHAPLTNVLARWACLGGD